MKKNYPLITPTKKSFLTGILNLARKMLLLLLLVGIAGTGLAQKGKGKWKKPKKNQDITISSCKQDMGNGMYRVNFSYNNPNDKVIKVPRGHSKVVIKKKTKWGGRRRTKFAINRFQPGVVENAFFVEFYDKQFVQWTLKNPGGKTKKSKANSNSAMCPEPSVIIPVYGQEGGKSEEPIGLELTSLAAGNAGEEPSEIVYQINNTEEVLLEVVPTDGNVATVIGILQSTFGRVYDVDAMMTDFVVDPNRIISENLATIDVFFPINRLLDIVGDDPLLYLNEVADINFFRPLYRPIQLESMVDVEFIEVARSQGDEAMFTDVVRESYVESREEDGTPKFVDGSGIKVGILSDSYDTRPFTGNSKATVDVIQGDLPGISNPNGYTTPVDVIKEYPYGEGSDEGNAMLQIVHDVAPGAELAFSTGVLSPRDFALSIKDLADAGCTIIADDVTYPLEPFFGEGQIAKAIREFTKIEEGEENDGNFYFTSAGNFGNKAYQSKFRNTAATPLTNFLPDGSLARAHDFNEDLLAEDDRQSISVVPGTYMIVLQWAEGLASQDNSEGATTDLDIYLADEDGNLIVGNNRDNNRENIKGDAAEVLVFQATGTGFANIMITSADGPAPEGLAFRYIAFRTTSDAGSNGIEFLEYFDGAPTVSGKAMTLEVITVGAVDYRVAQNEDPESQAFSSYAGILENNQLLEVDISAPDVVDTTSDTVGQLIDDGNDLLNFIGTSAAAPHAAAAFALMMSAIPEWYPEGLPTEQFSAAGNTNPSANQVLNIFKATTKPSSNPDQAGFGLINANMAFKIIAAQTPVVTGLTVEDGKTPSEEPFTVTIAGEYFPVDVPPVVVFDNEELQILEGNTDTQIQAIVGTFSGNPELQVITNASPGGGASNGLTFLPDGKIALNIIADGLEIKFGEPYDFTYRIEGLPEPYEEGIPEGMTLAEVLEELNLPALPNVQLAAPAAIGPYPDTNNYLIFPSFDFPEGTTELSPEAIAAYQINFKTGPFKVNKKDLIIRPLDASIVYGDAVQLELEYLFIDDEGGEEPITDLALLDAIKTAHDGDFYPTNTLAFINRFKAVVNTEEYLELLNGGSWMATENTIINRFKAVVNDMNLIDLDVELFDDYLTNRFKAVVNAEINRFKAVVNGQDLLTGNVSFNNRFKAVVNGSGLGGDDDENDYNEVFTIVDLLDDSPDEDQVPITTFYSLNLITGLDVTIGEEVNYSYPGAFLAPIAANFNITYGLARLSVEAANLSVQTPDIEIDYGVGITTEVINSLISPVPLDGCEVCPPELVFGIDGDSDFVYNETVETVFADPDCVPEDESCSIVIPYYFEDINTFEQFFIDDADEVGLILPAGLYFIKISDPQNYILDFGEAIGVLNVAPKTLLIEIQQSAPVLYGENTVGVSFNTNIDGLVGGDTQGTIFPGGIIPNYFEDVNDEEVPRTRIELGDPLDVGEYFIRVDKPENYSIVYGDDHGTLTIDKAILNACIDDVEIREGDLLTPDLIESTITGIYENPPYNDSLGTIFPNGISYVVVVNDKEYEITEAGPVDDEGVPVALLQNTYSIKIQDDGLENYVVFDGTTCSSTGVVSVTPCGDALILDFSNYVYDEFFGYYRYEDVALGSGKDLDALVTIQTRGNVNGFTLDQNSFPSGSDDRKQFRPAASFTITEAVPEPYVEFSITLVNGETNTPASNVGNLIAGILDVDGVFAYQEYVEINLPSEYTVEGGAAPTQLVVIENPDQGLLRINGYNDSYTAIFNGAPRVNVEAVYEDVSSLIYRIGAKGNFGNVSTRQYGIQFSCLTNFNSPVITTVEEFGSLMAETALENDCVFYNNPVGPLNDYYLYLEPKDGVSGAANITLTNMSTFEVDVYDFDDGAEIEIPMVSLDAGMYVVQTSIGNCQSDGFIVIKQ